MNATTRIKHSDAENISWTEELIHVDHDAMRMIYRVVDPTPLPVSRMYAVIDVVDLTKYYSPKGDELIHDSEITDLDMTKSCASIWTFFYDECADSGGPTISCDDAMKRAEAYMQSAAAMT